MSALSLATTPATPRAWLARALTLARQGETIAPQQRSAILAAARSNAQAALEGRIVWGEARLTMAYIESLGGPARHQAMLTALRLSYFDAPYVRDAAVWRVGTAFRHWQQIGAYAQERAVNEAVWIAMQDPRARRGLFAIALTTDAYIPLLARWKTARTRWRQQRTIRGDKRL